VCSVPGAPVQHLTWLSSRAPRENRASVGLQSREACTKRVWATTFTPEALRSSSCPQRIRITIEHVATRTMLARRCLAGGAAGTSTPGPRRLCNAKHNRHSAGVPPRYLCRRGVGFTVAAQGAAAGMGDSGSYSLEWKLDKLREMAVFMLPALTIPLAEPVMSMVDTICIGQVRGSVSAPQLRIMAPQSIQTCMRC
jgi:hypothetical protein